MLPTLLLVLLWGSEWATGAWGSTKDHTDLQAQSRGYTLTVPEVVTVPEHLCVLVPCFFSYPTNNWVEDTPAWGYWFRDGAKIDRDNPAATNSRTPTVNTWPRGRFQLVGNPRDYNCSLLITDARRSDSAWYYFRIERGTYVRYSFEKNKFYLNVTALPQKPAVYVPETLEPGQQVTAICVFDWDFEQCQAPTFSWTGVAVSSQETRVTTAHVSVLTFTPRPQDHDTILTCRVNFAGGWRVNVANSVQLYVSRVFLSLLVFPGVSHTFCSQSGFSLAAGKPDIPPQCQLSLVAGAPEVPVISISRANGSALEQQGDSPHLEVKKGQFLQLLCEAESRPPATLRWALQDQVLTSTQLSGSGSLELVLPQVKPEDAGRYTCHVENRLGFQTRTLNLSVQYAPENLTVTVSRANGTVPEVLGNATSLRVQEGQSLRLVCEIDGNPSAGLSWSRGSLTLSPTKTLDLGVLELPHVVMADAGEYTCRAQHPRISYHISLNLVVQGAPGTSHQVFGEQQGSWPLVLTLTRGALMGAGFLLTYGLTWLYYTRFRSP